MNVKVDAELPRKAKVTAAARCVRLWEFVSEAVRPQVKADRIGVASRLLEAASPGQTPPSETPRPLP